jgi:hypothetical protein
VLLERLPPPEAILQLTPELNVPVPVTVAFKLEIPPLETLLGEAVASMPVILSIGQATRIAANNGAKIKIFVHILTSYSGFHIR